MGYELNLVVNPPWDSELKYGSLTPVDPKIAPKTLSLTPERGVLTCPTPENEIGSPC